MELPELTKSQSWCCSEGCGDCLPVTTDFEYSRIEDRQGNLIESKTEKFFVSHCCRAELLLWDEEKQDHIDFDFIEEVMPLTID